MSPSPSAAQLVDTFDWPHHPLGPIERWPLRLRATVDLLLASALPMFVAWGPDLHVVYNDAFVQLLGTKHPGAMGRPHLEIWQEARESVYPYVQRARAGEPVLVKNVPFRIQRHGAAETVWVTFSFAPLRDDAGEVAGFHCVCMETTENVVAQQAQERERVRLQDLFRQAPGFLAVVRGPDHVFEVVNPGYHQLIGFRDAIGRPVAEVLPEVVEQGFIALLDTVRRTGEPYAGSSVRVMLQHVANGPRSEAHLDFVYQPILDAEGHVDGILVHGYDVSEKVASEHALLTFSNSIPAIAWVCDARGSLERFNSQWEAYTGVPVEAALGKDWAAQVHPDDLPRARDTWRAARDGTAPWQVEYRIRSAAGEWRWFRVHAVPQLGTEGKALRWFGTTTDIEDSRRAADLMRAADRQKDEFLATLSHELRNPLAPIRTAAEVLRRPNAAPGARERSIEIISRQVGHMAHLLDDLLDVTRVTQGRLVLNLQPLDVRRAVDAAVEAIQPLIARKQQAIEVRFEQAPLQALADEVRLTQILSNVMNNAAKYTDTGGRISLTVGAEAEHVVFTVIDNGIGLSQQAIATIFRMFSQENPALERSEGGLGIGLALVKGLVELHRGTISAHSAGPNSGSRFEIRIPATDAPAVVPPPAPAASSTPTTTPPARTSPKTILMADDNADALEALAQLLEFTGHTVHRAADGLQAVALASQVKPEVAVLDIGMPGLNGYEVAQRIRAEAWSRDTLLIAATGWGQRGDLDQATAAGFDEHLTKPFDPQQLLQLVERGRRVTHPGSERHPREAPASLPTTPPQEGL